MEETPSQRRLTLRKPEKLRHRSLVNALFSEGSTLYDFPIRLTWRALSHEQLEGSFKNRVPEKIGRLQMMITVPKKKRRHAVDRVLMRRRIREAYRLQRSFLYDTVERNDIASLQMSFIFLCEKNVPYNVIFEKIGNILSRLNKKLETQC